jgi:hypothetical protein
MDPQDRPSKTEAGVDEIAQRSGRLVSGARRLLILIDGNRSIAELERLSRPGELPIHLKTLLDLGLIRIGDAPSAERDSSTVQSPGASVDDDLPAATITLEIQRLDEALAAREQALAADPPRAISFRDLKEQAAEELLVRSHYQSEVLAARLLACSTPKALRSLLRESEAELVRTMGARDAVEFARRVGAQAVDLC